MMTMLATPDTTGPCTAGGLTWISGYQSERFGEYPNGVLKRTWRVCHGRLLTGGGENPSLSAAARDPPDRYIGFACAPRVFISAARFLCADNGACRLTRPTKLLRLYIPDPAEIFFTGALITATPTAQAMVAYENG